MTKMRKKSDLPMKSCVTCARPMVWRKSWARDWDAVRHCSERCRKTKAQASTIAASLAKVV